MKRKTTKTKGVIEELNCWLETIPCPISSIHKPCF